MAVNLPPGPGQILAIVEALRMSPSHELYRDRIQLSCPAHDLPPEPQTIDGARQRVEDNEIKQLPISDLLEWKAPERADRLVIQSEGVDRTK
jgi:hypothetical protein